MAQSDDPRVTVIPMTNKALEAVTTPFVAFEHPFKDRPGRFTRQADEIVMTCHSILFGDTWPDSYWASTPFPNVPPYRDIEQAHKFDSIQAWPETILYNTSLARTYPIDEAIVYRPAVHFWGNISDTIIEKSDWTWAVSKEAALHVEDRGRYPIPDPSPVTLPPESCELSVIAIQDRFVTDPKPSFTSLDEQTASSWQFIYIDATDGRPLGAAFNQALSKANGKYIAVWDLHQKADPLRFELQLKTGADCIETGHGIDKGNALREVHLPVPLPHSYTYASRTVSGLSGTYMFHRRVFERLGGCIDCLHTGHLYDLYLRILQDRQLRIAMIDKVMVFGEAIEAIHGRAYSQFVFNDIANNHRAKEGFHEWTIFDREK